MANNSIRDFKNAFNGGTRANRFQVSGLWPVGVVKPTVDDLKVKIFASSLPRVEVGTIAIPYRGRAYYLPGDRQYSVWSVDVFDDSGDNSIWRAFNTWKNQLDSHVTHKVYQNNFSYDKLQKNWIIRQLDLNGNQLRKIDLYNCWPSEVGALTFDMGSTEPAVFRVTMMFDYIKIDQINSTITNA